MMQFNVDGLSLSILVASAIVTGGSLASIWWRGRHARRQRALAAWRVKLRQLQEDHENKRDAWTRQGNPRYTHAHARTVAAAQALIDHVDRMMPQGPL